MAEIEVVLDSDLTHCVQQGLVTQMQAIQIQTLRELQELQQSLKKKTQSDIIQIVPKRT